MSLREWAQDTEEVLLLYFVGHGTISPSGELCLALPTTEFNHPDVTGIEYRHIRSAPLDSPARIKVVILDCCFSGRAIEALCNEKEIADVADTRGAYTITASDQAAHVPPLPEQTHKCASFTGEFLDLIRTGIPDGPEMLTLNMIYSRLRTRLQGRQLPIPNQRGVDTAGEFTFTRNGALLQPPIEEPFPHWKPPALAGRPTWHKRIIAAAAMTVLAASGAYVLGRAEDQAASASLPCGMTRPAASASRPVVVGLGVFSESELLGQIYVKALRDRGVAVTTKKIGPRETYYPQVCAGQITIVPEYNGALLTTSVDPGSGAVTTGQVDAALKVRLPASLAILEPSSAQDKDSVTVTQTTAAKYHLTSIADLRRLPGVPVIGGSAQFYDREQGYAGLRSQYGLTSLAFMPLDNSGPLTIHALASGEVQAADVFTTNPMVKKDHLVSLADRRNVFRAENIVPLVYRPDVNATVIAALNAVSALLTGVDLQNMDKEILLDHDSIPVVAQDWLTQVGLG
ncbi:MAG TPA: ABC transporter substrate-binding protein [Trebonia sp.]|nr:ABC transporter substrate-binding protein [Trebonia sp.]